MASDELKVSTPAGAADALATPPTQSTEPPTQSTEPPNQSLEPPTQANTRPTRSSPTDGREAPPRLADGIELIGEFEDSGFKQAPFIARRADGQVVQLPKMLYQLSEQIDGKASYDEIARRFSDAVKRQVEADDVRMLVEERLRPLGIVAQHADGESIELNKVDPLLALKFRAAVIPDSAVRGITTIFRPLFLPPVWILAVLAMLGLNGWLLFVHGISQGLRSTLYQPALMLMLIGGVILATAFHEIGHATATRYGGAKPGVMGVGIYIVWPAFYTDITDAYRLGKWGRLRTDVGGMYFNVIFALLIGALYAATSFQPLLLLILLQDFAIFQQALPFLRLDGYYILSDLTGVPDIFLRIRPVLSSFIPGRPADDRVTELKRWVRIVVSAYVLLIVLALLVIVVGLVINLPRMVATGYDSAVLHLQAISPAFSHGQPLKGVLNAIEALFLILPGAGLAYTAVRVLRRTSTGAITWTAGRPGRQAVLLVTGAAATALAVFSWWPNGEYRPIQPSEKGTLAGLVQQVKDLPTGRPSLSAARQQQLGGAPTQRELQQRAALLTLHSKQSAGPSTSSTAPTSTTTTATTATTDTTTTGASTTPTDTTTAATPTTPAATTSTPASTTTTPASTTTTP